MFDVQTPLNILHRRTLPVNNVTTLVASPGLWLSIDAAGKIENITDSVTAPAVAKVTIDNLSTNMYESADVRGGQAITLLEGAAIVKVDGKAVALVDSSSNPISYVQGSKLTVAHYSTSQCLAADLGKLILATTGDMVYATVEFIPSTGIFVIKLVANPYGI